MKSIYSGNVFHIPILCKTVYYFTLQFMFCRYVMSPRGSCVSDVAIGAFWHQDRFSLMYIKVNQFGRHGKIIKSHIN